MTDTCLSCGSALEPDAVRCAACGEPVDQPVSRECANCGQSIEAAANEPCPACGHLEAPVRCDRHPDRVAHGRCVVCGSAVCERCDRDDVGHYLCPRHHEVEIIEGWAQVYSTSSDVEADLIRDNLRSEGIDAEVFSQKDHVLRVEMGELSPVRVLVPAYRYERAATLVREHMDEHGELAFACPNCGEAYAPGSPRCEACGAALPPSRQRETRTG